jgi:antitoxin ParD1/3/4
MPGEAVAYASALRLRRIERRPCAFKRTHSTSGLPKFANNATISPMATMNISLPDSLKDFVDEQVNERGYGTSSEYVRELIRKEQDRLQLRNLLLAGASSAPTKPVDDAYFEGLRRKVRATKSGTRR